VKFNHDFIGREALEGMVAEGRDTARSKVTLVWNADDAARLVGYVFQPGPGAKILNLPMPLYATFQFDRVLADGKDIGRTAFTGYSANERAILALATVDSAYAGPGTDVTVLWGESPNTVKPTAEQHVQVALRATVQPAPITEYARTAYRAATA
jgi:glycine cleavage system aminomethyltransferase T